MTEFGRTDDGDGDDAPSFASWRAGFVAALRGDADSDVPCGQCTACCRSSQFVQIAPDEVDTLAHVPAALLFLAPRSPAGHVLMGHDADGRCPMLGDHGCTIYEHRPRTCRTYDCRVFAAAGVEPDQPLVAERVRGWQFAHPTERDRHEHAAVLAAARERLDELAGDADRQPGFAVRVAIRAVELGADPDESHASSGDPSTSAPSSR